MDEKLDIAEKKLLVELVRLTQKRGMKGCKGSWKEFLNSYDKKFGASLSDPTRRSNDVLVAFLKSFTGEDDLKFFDQVMQCHEKRNFVEQLAMKAPANESPEQRLVRLTLEHPKYSLDYSFPSFEEGWVVTKLHKKSEVIKSNSMVAVDCEMVLCEDGAEALVRVCVVDRNLQVKLDELVNPNNPVVDYRTDITGITADELKGVTCSLGDVQKSLAKLLSDGTILIGHGLNNDLQALKLDHARVIDTSFVFTYSDGNVFRRPSLSNLCKSVLGYEVRKKGAPHNCIDDARAAMKLVLAKIAGKADGAIPFVQEDVPDIDMSKLFMHRIPINVTSEELTRAVPGNFTIEIKHPSFKKGGADKHSAFALFKNPQDANEAFENVEGNLEKDSSGRPQKLVTFRLSSGATTTLYVRKMMIEGHGEEILSSKKRDVEAMNKSGPAKKLKMDEKKNEETMVVDSDKCCEHLKEIERLQQEIEEKGSKQCCDHLKEIEMLKKELKIKELEVDTLHKAISKVQKEQKKKGKK